MTALRHGEWRKMISRECYGSMHPLLASGMNMSFARSGVGYRVSPKISSELPHLLEILHASAVFNL